MANINQETETIPSQIELWAKTNPDKPAFIIVGEKETETFSRREVYTYGGKMASFLKSIGAMKGDVIAISICNSRNCVDRLVCELGVQMAGCVSVEAHTVVKGGNKELVKHLAGSNAKILVIDYGTFYKGDLTSCETRHYGFDVALLGLPSLKHVISLPSLRETVSNEDNMFIEQVKPDDIAVLSTTSGTTSNVKLVPQSQAFIINMGHFVCNALGDITKVQYYNNASMNWVTGYISCYLATGMTRVMQNHKDRNTPNPEDILKSESKYVGFLSNEEVHAIYLKNKDQMPIEPLLEKLILGGQPISKTIMKEALVIAKMVVVLYGSTETAPVAFLCVDNPDDYKDFCVGKEFSDVQLKIVDENKQEVATGQCGIAYIKRKIMTNGYLNEDGVVTRERFTDDGWFVTDDISYRDDSGNLYVTGRGSEVIMLGELLLYPQHMESFLTECPTVNDVVVVGIPSQIVHHELCAIIQPKPGFDDPIRDVKAFIHEKLKGWEYDCTPKYFVLSDSIIRNKNGKILRQKMTEFAMKRLQVNAVE